MVTSRTVLSRSGIVMVLALLGALAIPQAAHAATFAISTPAGTLFTGVVTIVGDKDGAASVDVTNGTATCAVPAGAETFSCDLALNSGNHTITATQTAADSTVTALTVPVRALAAPGISTTGVTNGTIAGTGFPGAGIDIDIVGGGGNACGVVQPNGAWTCQLGIGSGVYTILATQTWGNVPSERGGTSSATSIHVDANPPAAPLFATPLDGSRVASQPTIFSGTGENGGRVEVLVDSARVCVSPVINDQWSCTASLTVGARTVHGIQSDAAGNITVGTGFTITVGAAAAPVTPAQPPVETAPDRQPATPTVPALPAPIAPFLPPPVGGTSGMPPFETWELPTDYGAAIPSASTTNGASWLLGLGLGLAFALLVALPLRLLVSTVRRKRGYVPREPLDELPLLGPRVTAVIFLAAAVLLAALAGGIQSEVRYLRLAMAIGLALAVLNGVGILAAKLTGRTLGWSTGIRLAPLMLAIATATALASRIGGIQPPIVVGIVLAVRFAPTVAARARGIISLVEVSAIVTLGFAAWLAQSALGPVDGFLPSLVSEALSALCIAALGSAMVMLLPVHRMPGRLIWEFRRTAWAAMTLVTATVAGVVIAGGSGFPVAWIMGGALIFAAVSVAAWAWVYLVEPNLNAAAH